MSKFLTHAHQSISEWTDWAFFNIDNTIRFVAIARHLLGVGA